MKLYLTVFLLFFALSAGAQTKKTYFPAWTYHTRNANIYGVSLGLGSFGDKVVHTDTYGLKVEAIGLGLFCLFLPQSPVAENDSDFAMHVLYDTISEHINGIVLSASGTVCNCITNGIAMGMIGQIQSEVNGASATMLNMVQLHKGIQLAILFNQTYKMRGIQAAFIANETYDMKGLQVGIFNKSKHTRGLQLGIWNVNERRKLPFINWNFRNKKAA